MLAALAASVMLSESTMPIELKVMTYNLRYATAPDGANVWANRREMAIGLIRKHDPDVLGVQEALHSQIEELQTALPDHALLGVGRDDGLQRGEYAALFVRKSKLGMREGGTRWISSDPLKPSSKGPGANVTRVFSWGEFFLADGRKVLIMNCHLDHESEPARMLGAQQMRAFSDERKELPTLIMGDFNCGPKSAPIVSLVAGGRFASAMPAQGPFGTFNGFKPDQVNGEMIDHILASREWTISNVEIDRFTLDGRVPSDHFPVIATATLK